MSLVHNLGILTEAGGVRYDVLACEWTELLRWTGCSGGVHGDIPHESTRECRRTLDLRASSDARTHLAITMLCWCRVTVPLPKGEYSTTPAPGGHYTSRDEPWHIDWRVCLPAHHETQQAILEEVRNGRVDWYHSALSQSVEEIEAVLVAISPPKENPNPT